MTSDMIIMSKEMLDLLHSGKYDPYIDSPTRLIEDAARNLKVDYEGGPLDQEHHWIWSMGDRMWREFLTAEEELPDN